MLCKAIQTLQKVKCTDLILALNFYTTKAIESIMAIDVAEFKATLKEVLKEDPYIIKEALAELAIKELVTKEDLKMLIEMINKRFEAVDKRFEDMRYYIDRRIGFLEKLIVGFNSPILLLLLKLVLA